MLKFDKRVKLNWIEKLIEWFRLNREIGKLNKTINRKEKKAKGSLLGYKHSGVPVLKLNREFKRKERDSIKLSK